MQNRINRRKQLHSNRLLLLFDVLLILVVAGVNFQIIPNINTYINGGNIVNARGQAPVKASFTNEKKYRGHQTMIQVEANKNWHGQKGRYLRLELASPNNANDFARNIDASARYTAQQMHESHLSPRDIRLSSKNGLLFSQYGYNLNQFGDLIGERYSGNVTNSPGGTKFVEHLLNLVSVAITVISLLSLIWFVITPGNKKLKIS